MRGQTRGSWWFWIHCKHLFCMKNIPWARKRTKIMVKSDDSSLFTGLRGWNLAQGMFFMQNKCLQWIQNHEEPLVWPLTCYLKHIFLVCFFQYSESMGNFFSQDFQQSRPLILCTLMTKWIEKNKNKKYVMTSQVKLYSLSFWACGSPANSAEEKSL